MPRKGEEIRWTVLKMLIPVLVVVRPTLVRTPGERAPPNARQCTTQPGRRPLHKTTRARGTLSTCAVLSDTQAERLEDIGLTVLRSRATFRGWRNAAQINGVSPRDSACPPNLLEQSAKTCLAFPIIVIIGNARHVCFYNF